MDAVLQALALDVQQVCRLGDIALAAAQGRFHNEALIVVHQVLQAAQRGLAARLSRSVHPLRRGPLPPHHRLRQALRQQRLPAADVQGVVQRVIQFPDIAGPAVPP